MDETNLTQYGNTEQLQPRNSTLIGYIVPKLRHARDTRDGKFREIWKEYTRLWRGMWQDADRNRDSERSKLISPALQQAVEMTSAEIEEAAFGRIAWFDIQDDLADEEKADAVAYRDQLLEDFEFARVTQAAAQIFLLGCIYGTGIGKINIGMRDHMNEERFFVKLEPIRPDEFLIDPAACHVDEAHFVAHETIKPLHSIRAKIKDGTYRKVPVFAWTGERRSDTTGTGRDSHVDVEDDGVLITEYYGKVPGKYVGGGGDELVESIITIANENVVLRAMKNPYTYQDRPVLAYQHDTVPGEFWGRGVCEKGYNPQKALDAELRARMDALALITAPMLGADVTRLPRNPDLRVRPGKVVLARGRPSEVLEPIGFSPQSLALSFQQSGDLERMVQMSTGAMDSAIPIKENRRNETASGMSQMMAGFLKRAKRTMANIEREFLDPLITRSLWRYMQFDPERYPQDMRFVVHSTMGIMAKEVEQTTLTQVLGFVPPESPAHKVITAAILNNTTSAEEGEIKKAVEEMMKPPTPEQQQMQQFMQQMQMQMAQLQMQNAQLENQKLEAETQKLLAEAKLAAVKAEFEDDRVEIEAANAATNAENARNKGRAVEAQKEGNRARQQSAKKGK